MKIQTQSIASELTPCLPMTLEELVKGKPINYINQQYDECESLDDIRRMISERLSQLSLETVNLYFDKVFSGSMVVDKDKYDIIQGYSYKVYYRHPESKGCINRDILLLTINPDKFIYDDVKCVIEQFNKE